MSFSFHRGLMKFVAWLTLLLGVLGGWYVWNLWQTEQGQASTATKPLPVVTVGFPLKMNIVEWDDFVGRLEAIE